VLRLVTSPSAPIVRFLVSGGASSLHVPFEVLVYSVIVFIVIPLTACCYGDG
jgi:arsenite transporter